MIHDYVMIFIGTSLIAGCLSYACWTRLRVILLRQRLFDIRDHLWDEAQAYRGLDDPAYVEARHRLNAAIRLAHWLTLPVISQSIDRTTNDAPTFTKSNNTNFQVAIETAYDDFAQCLVSYLMRQTACGISVTVAAICYNVICRVFGPFAQLACWFVGQFGRPISPTTVRYWMGSQRFDDLSKAELAIYHSSMRSTVNAAS